MTLSRPVPARLLRMATASSLAVLLAACATGPTTGSPTTGSTSPVAAGSAAGRSSPAAEAAAPRAATGTGAAPAPNPALTSAPAVAEAALAPMAKPADPDATNPADWKPIDPLQPDARVDADLVTTDLWVRLRRGYAMPELDNDLVRKWEQYYAGKPDYMRRMTERGGRYLFHVIEEIEKRKMPTELALLPFVESAFNPQAMSHAKASGMWQFIPSTGRTFQLKQNVFRDDRRDVLASTRAALDYLQRLHGMFGDWQLALAAYNWGEGNVQRAINKNTRAGLPTDYSSLGMPNETRDYVPKLQAIRNIVGKPEQFSVTLPELRNHPYFLSMPIQHDIDVATAAKLAELPMEEFRQLNPQMNKPVILAAGTPQILLPYDNANNFVRNLSRHRGALATWTAWVVPRTMKTAAAAQQVGMSEASFREVNHIPPRMLVKAGSTLLVPRSERRQENVDEHIADNASLSLAPDLPPMKRVQIKAGRKGLTVAQVAQKYRMSPAMVAQLNRVSAGASFKPGQRIVVLVPNKAARGTALAGKGRGKGAAVAHGGRHAGKAGVRVASKAGGKRGRGGKVRVAAR